MVMTALWAWQGAGDLVLGWEVARPDLVEWAVRSGAIAIFAAAQLVILFLIAGRIFRRGTFDVIVGFTAAAVFALASVSAIACGLAGR